MKIVALSDSHNSFGFDHNIILTEKPDLIIHCGDGVRQAEELSFLASCKVVYVCGNCDAQGKYFEIVMADKHKIFVTHGHLYGVSYTLSELNKAADESGSDIVLYGHTHIPNIEFIYNKWFINPGSVSRPRDMYEATYAVITVNGDNVYTELKNFR